MQGTRLGPVPTSIHYSTEKTFERVEIWSVYAIKVVIKKEPVLLPVAVQ